MFIRKVKQREKAGASHKFKNGYQLNSVIVNAIPYFQELGYKARV